MKALTDHVAEQCVCVCVCVCMCMFRRVMNTEMAKDVIGIASSLSLAWVVSGLTGTAQVRSQTLEVGHHTHTHVCVYICMYVCIYTGCPGGNVPDFGRMFHKLNYTDITQNTYIRS